MHFTSRFHNPLACVSYHVEHETFSHTWLSFVAIAISTAPWRLQLASNFDTICVSLNMLIVSLLAQWRMENDHSYHKRANVGPNKRPSCAYVDIAPAGHVTYFILSGYRGRCRSRGPLTFWAYFTTNSCFRIGTSNILVVDVSLTLRKKDFQHCYAS